MTIEVTGRGRTVALLTPVREAAPLERVRAAGEVTPPAGELTFCRRRYLSKRGRSCPRVRSSGFGAMSAGRATYLDCSPIVKLMVAEPESAALRR